MDTINIMQRNIVKLLAYAGLAIAVLFTGNVYAQNDDALKAQYDADLRYCESPSVLDKETCKREAGAAYTEALKGNLTDASSDTKTNRCQYLQGIQKADCEKLMNNPDAEIQGSVESGGIIRSMEYEYTPAERRSSGPAGNSAGTQSGNNSVTETYTVN